MASLIPYWLILLLCIASIIIAVFVASNPDDRKRWSFPGPLRYVFKSTQRDQYTNFRRGVFSAVVLFTAGLWSSVLLHLTLLLMIRDGLTRRAPPAILLVPVIFYGGYHLFSWREQKEIAAIQMELQATTPGRLLVFDPANQALVLPHRNPSPLDAYEFIINHEIPVVYAQDEKIKPEGYLSYRIASPAQCEMVNTDYQLSITKINIDKPRNSPHNRTCLLIFPEAPRNTIIRVDASSNRSHENFIHIQEIAIMSNGKKLGVFEIATALKLLPFPWFIAGCWPTGGPEANGLGVGCIANFWRSNFSLDTMPKDVDRTLYDTPLALMLGIKKISDDALKYFTAYPENADILEKIKIYKAKMEDKAFVRLETILAGGEEKDARNLERFLVRNPARLASYGERMMQRLTEFENAIVPNTKTGLIRRDERGGPLAFALASLSPQDFASLADQAFVLAQHKDFVKSYPSLYLRAADVGPQALDFYKKMFFEIPYADSLYLDTLALCRIGVADPEIIAEMKTRYIVTDDDPQKAHSPKKYSLEGRDQMAALFLALMKFREQDFLQKNDDSAPRDDHGWRQAIYAGKGQTAIGPNNCMISRSANMPAILANRLEDTRNFKGGLWTERSP